MSDVNNKLTKVPGRLAPATTDGVLAGADVIYDDYLGKSQAELNVQFAEGEIPPQRIDPIGPDQLQPEAVTPSKLSPAVMTNVINPALAVKADADYVDARLLTKASVASVNTLNEQVATINDDIDGLDTNVRQNKADIDDINYELEYNRYTKEEIDNIISRTPETDTIVINVPQEYQEDIATWLDANTPDGTDPETGRSVRANKLYRVPGPTDTTYSEWAWDGEEYIMLANKDYGIDDEPVEGSDNVIKSGGLATILKNANDKKYIYLLLDGEDKILMAFCDNGDSSSAFGLSSVSDVYDYLELTLDKYGKVVSKRLPDGTLCEYRMKIDDVEFGEKAKRAVRSNASVALSALTDYNGWELAQSVQDNIVLEKGRQMVEIKWTPKNYVPKTGYRDVDKTLQLFNLGSPITGLPYSGTQAIDKVVGYDVSFETFMTAVNNPYSLFYTECIRADAQQYSAWGKSYNGIGSAGAYYGNVCSELSSYCAGLPMPTKTYSYVYVTGETVGKTIPQNEQAFKIGDILWISYHCIGIRGIKRDESGAVVGVMIQEQTSAVPGKARYIIYEDLVDETEYTYYDATDPQRNSMAVTTYRYPFTKSTDTLASFMAKYIEPDHAVYRNLKAYDNSIKYAWDVDSHYDFEYNNDICTFAGDKACFREGETIALNYNLDGEHSDWEAIELYKDDSNVPTIYLLSDIDKSALPSHSKDGNGNDVSYTPSLKNNTLVIVEYYQVLIEKPNDWDTNWTNYYRIVDGEYEIITDDEAPEFETGEYYMRYGPLTYGAYKARMKKGSAYSDYTYFHVINVEVSCEREGNAVTCTFDSANAEPIAVRICNAVGDVGIEHILTDKEKSNKEVVLSILDVHNMSTANPMYIKVYFETDFGRVTNEPLLIE